MVSFKEFQSIDLRVARIASVEEVEGKDRLYKLSLDVGGESKQTVAGIKPFYSKEELEGRLVVVVNGLEPSIVAGMKSETMLLASKKEDGSYGLIEVPEGVKDGTKVE